MDSGWATVIAAVVAGFASVGGILIRFRKENRKDHGAVMGVLERIDNKIDRVGARVDSHIDWHLMGGPNGRSVEGNQD